MSSGGRQGTAPSSPITPPRATAATSWILTASLDVFRKTLDSDRRTDRRMVLVCDQLEVRELVVEDRRRAAAHHQRRVRERSAGELCLDLIAMVVVDVAVAARPDEIADGEV